MDLNVNMPTTMNFGTENFLDTQTDLKNKYLTVGSPESGIEGSSFNISFNNENPKIENAINNESFGRKIFQTADGLSEKLKVIRRRLEAKIAKGGQNFSTTDTLEMQYLVTQMSIYMDLTSKVGDKTSQGLQTLFRNQ